MPQVNISNTPSKNSSFDLSYSDLDAEQSEMDIDLINSPKTRAPQLDGPEPVMTLEHERDPIYFCEVVMLKAEDRVFCVPKSGLLEHGSFFQELFDDNKLKEGHVAVAGISEQNPIVLDGVDKIHFHNFLRLIYPFRGVDPPTGDEHWLGILDLATKWGFLEIRELALSHLEHLFTSPSPDRDPIRALFLCQKYNIHQHIKLQFEIIITAIVPLDRAALLAGGIDDETILQLMQLREKWFCRMVWGEKGSGTGTTLLPCRLSAKAIVDDHFSRSKGERKSSEEGPAEEKEVMQGEGLLANDQCGQGTAGLQDVDNMDDIQSVTSDMSEIPSDVVEVRLPRLILLHEQKYRVMKEIQALARNPGGLGVNRPRIQKMNRVVQAYERKIEKLWKYGANLEAYPIGDPEVYAPVAHIELFNIYECGLAKARRLKKALERMLGPRTISLDLTIHVTSPRPLRPKIQDPTTYEFIQQYGLLTYTKQHLHDGQTRRVVVLEAEFGEWLAAFKRLTDLAKTENGGRDVGV